MGDENEEIREWLKKYRLGKYYEKFIEHGYDDLDQLLDLSPDKLERRQKAVGMENLEGHIERLHSAITIETSVRNNPLPVKDKQEEKELPDEKSAEDQCKLHMLGRPKISFKNVMTYEGMSKPKIKQHLVPRPISA